MARMTVKQMEIQALRNRLLSLSACVSGLRILIDSWMGDLEKDMAALQKEKETKKDGEGNKT